MTDEEFEPSAADFEWELRRLGVDLERFGGLASEPNLSPEDVLTWLRQLPTGLEHSAFMKSLESAGPRSGLGRVGCHLEILISQHLTSILERP